MHIYQTLECECDRKHGVEVLVPLSYLFLSFLPLFFTQTFPLQTLLLPKQPYNNMIQYVYIGFKKDFTSVHISVGI